MMNEMESASRKIVETMTSTERCGPRLCKEERESDAHLQTKPVTNLGGVGGVKKQLKNRNGLKQHDTNPQEGAQWQPHLYVLHFLQPEMRDLRLFGLASWSEVAEELGK